MGNDTEEYNIFLERIGIAIVKFSQQLLKVSCPLI